MYTSILRGHCLDIHPMATLWCSQIEASLNRIDPSEIKLAGAFSRRRYQIG